jgi:hypothetical protein
MRWLELRGCLRRDFGSVCAMKRSARRIIGVLCAVTVALPPSLSTAETTAAVTDGAPRAASEVIEAGAAARESSPVMRISMELSFGVLNAGLGASVGALAAALLDASWLRSTEIRDVTESVLALGAASGALVGATLGVGVAGDYFDGRGSWSVAAGSALLAELIAWRVVVATVAGQDSLGGGWTLATGLLVTAPPVAAVLGYELSGWLLPADSALVVLPAGASGLGLGLVGNF